MAVHSNGKAKMDNVMAERGDAKAERSGVERRQSKDLKALARL